MEEVKEYLSKKISEIRQYQIDNKYYDLEKVNYISGQLNVLNELIVIVDKK